VTKTSEKIYDELLVIRYQGGDDTAFPLLVERWQKRLVNYARMTTHDSDLANDIVQDTWISVIKKIRSLRDSGSFRPWLYQILTRKIYDHFKHVKVQNNHVAASLSAENLQVDDSNQRLFESRQEVNFVLKQLSQEHRSVLVLHYLEEFEIQDIAGILTIPRGTVKSRLHHARVNFKQLAEASDD